MAKITKATTLVKILEIKGGDKILAKNGVPCLSCPMAQFETDKLKIGEVCKMYKLNLEKILKLFLQKERELFVRNGSSGLVMHRGESLNMKNIS